MKKDESAAKCMSGNFCRCTGYRPILGACSKADVIDIEDLVGKPSATPVSNTESNEKGVVVNGGTGFMPITNASEAETHASTTTATKRHIGTDVIISWMYNVQNTVVLETLKRLKSVDEIENSIKSLEPTFVDFFCRKNMFLTKPCAK